ncbi:MAG: hypothetical protein LBK06_07225 [Planctomycetaceae bacterium]|jgi:hypothetical protein|nr:hypothetical protein [Planctomycetaceae bacterium]
MQKKSSFPRTDNRIQNARILPAIKMLQKTLMFFVAFVVGFVCFSGCSHNAVNRGHIISLEYNRPPWIGCPADTGCDTERTCKLGHDKSSCDCGEGSSSGVADKKIRRHCGLKPNCTSKNPCCEVPGCGMWVDPSDPNSFAGNSRVPRACGLTPFCSPMKPCGMTPHCGRPVNPYLFSQPAMMPPMSSMSPYGFNGIYAGSNGFPVNGNFTNANGSISQLPVTVPPTIQSTVPNSPATISPTPISTPPTSPNNNTPPPKPNQAKPANIAGPNGILVSMGIVPGVSVINGGGYVAASGVVTPYGMMTANGIRLPNGTTNSQMVLKACGSNPACTPSRPCGMLPGCGAAVPVGLVSNNAVPLAAEIIARSRGGGVVQAVDGNNYNTYGNSNGYGNVMQVNGMAAQNLRNGASYQYPQNGRGTNYIAGAVNNSRNNDTRTPPMLQPELYNNDSAEDELDDESEVDGLVDEAVVNQGKKSTMPLPRFHPVPTEPTFNRRRGISVQKTADETGSNKFSKNSIRNNNSTDETAIENAYLKGMVAALDEVDAELDSQMDEIENKKMKSLAVEKAERLQAKIEAKAVHDAETAEFETEQQKLQEQAIQSEQLKFEQQRNAKILARRQAEIDKESQILAIERNRFQQEQLALARNSQNNNRQPNTTNDPNIQPASYQTTKKDKDKDNENVFASAVNFLRGNSKEENKPVVNQQNKNQKNTKNIVAQNNTKQKPNSKQTKNSNQQSHQQTGTLSRFFSPITNLVSSDTKSKTQSQKNKSKKTNNTDNNTESTDNTEIAGNNLPTRPATFADGTKRKVNIP